MTQKTTEMFSKTLTLQGGIFVTAFADSAGLRRVSVGFEQPPADKAGAPKETAAVLDRALSAASAAVHGETAEAGKVVSEAAAPEKTPDFHRRVWRETAKIPHGQTRTYSEIAGRLGGENYRRVVARALAKNPFPILIPCHRVVGARDGGGYSAGGGRRMKQALLSMETQK
ncbi:MAG: methylated-DNA--[protein]-cysteine S-methyltransferase [Candidatus Dadabacteria bacterium]|nr:methylated-DNA--[protein]-cysteine S-methyltransferase [Candidatus Dadabacteria bacterium]